VTFEEAAWHGKSSSVNSLRLESIGLARGRHQQEMVAGTHAGCAISNSKMAFA
jgi:hypothetical protein